MNGGDSMSDATKWPTDLVVTKYQTEIGLKLPNDSANFGSPCWG